MKTPISIVCVPGDQPTNYTPETKLQIKVDDVVWRDVGDELVVLELTTSTYLTLNGAAKLLWTTLADGATFAQLMDSLSERYGIPAEQARTDTEAFLAALTDRELVVPEI